MKNNLWWNTSFDGTQPLIEGDLIEDYLWRKTICDGRRPLMGDNLWWKTLCVGREHFVCGRQVARKVGRQMGRQVGRHIGRQLAGRQLGQAVGLFIAIDHLLTRKYWGHMPWTKISEIEQNIETCKISDNEICSFCQHTKIGIARSNLEIICRFNILFFYTPTPHNKMYPLWPLLKQHIIDTFGLLQSLSVVKYTYYVPKLGIIPAI